MKKIISIIICLSILLCAAVCATSSLLGDANGDGEVDNKDVVTLFRHLSGMSVTCIEANCDVNKDNEIDNKDVVTLFRLLSSGEPVNPSGMSYDDDDSEDSGDFSELFG